MSIDVNNVIIVNIYNIIIICNYNIKIIYVYSIVLLMLFIFPSRIVATLGKKFNSFWFFCVCLWPRMDNWSVIQD